MATKEEKAAAKAAKDAEKAAAKAAGATSVAAEPPTVARGVYDGNGKLVRVYSLADHGEDYQKLAGQFATSKGRKGFTTKPHTVELTREPQAADTKFVKVLGPSNDVVRVYSESQHGKDYKALADQFIAKFPNRQYKLAA